MSMVAPTLSPEQIAIVNAGSSSIKFALFAAGEQLLFKGQVEKIGVGPRLRANSAAGDLLVERQWSADEVVHQGATQIILDTIVELNGGQPLSGVGHRVVHGGMRFSEPTLVTKEILTELRTLVPLAPLHQPHNLAPIEVIRTAAPDLPQVACFDTAFHRGQPELAQMFALPRELTEAGIRRYGFHGLSYEFVSGKLNTLDPALATRKEVVDGCQWLGAKLNAAANERAAGRIDLRSSAVRIWVVPTDEERIIARHTAALVHEPAE